MKKINPLLRQVADYYISRKQQLVSIIRCTLGVAILLAIAMYMFVRLLFQEFDISLAEDVLNMIRATGIATLFICILFSPCLLLEAVVYLSRIESSETDDYAETDANVYQVL